MNYMGILKAIGGFFVFLLMGLSISAIFMSLLVDNIFKNVENVDKLLLEKSQTYIENNKEDLKDYLLGREEISALKKEQIMAVCQSKQVPLSDTLCQNIGSMTETQARDKFVDELMTMNSQQYLGSELEKFAAQAKSEVDSAVKPIKETIGPTKDYLIIGILGYLVTCGLVFALNILDIKGSFYKISKSTFFNIIPFFIFFLYISMLTPESLMAIITKIVGTPVQLSQIPQSLVDMMLNLILEVLKSSISPLLTLAIIWGLVALTAAITLKILIIKASKTDAKSYKQPPDTKKP